MKVQELLVEEQTLFAHIKQLNAEFKALAKKLDVRLVHGQGWPAVLKDGAIYGGGFAPLGGQSRENREDHIFEFDARLKMFLKEVGKKLEAAMREGQKVAILPGADRQGTRVEAKPGEVGKQLIDSLRKVSAPGIYGKPAVPCVAWYVSAPAGIHTSALIEINARGYGKNISDKGFLINFAIKQSDDKKRTSAMMRALTDIMKDQKSIPGVYDRGIYGPKLRRFLGWLIPWVKRTVTQTSVFTAVALSQSRKLRRLTTFGLMSERLELRIHL